MHLLTGSATALLMAFAPTVAHGRDVQNSACRVGLSRPEFDQLQDAACYLPTADGAARL